MQHFRKAISTYRVKRFKWHKNNIFYNKKLRKTQSQSGDNDDYQKCQLFSVVTPNTEALDVGLVECKDN